MECERFITLRLTAASRVYGVWCEATAAETKAGVRTAKAVAVAMVEVVATVAGAELEMTVSAGTRAVTGRR